MERLAIIEAWLAEGQTLAQALGFVGITQADYDEWREQYAGLMRTLGPMARAPAKKRRRTPAKRGR